MLQLQSVEKRDIDTWIVFGEVVMVHIRRDLLIDGVYDMAGAQPILRAGGAGDYVAIERSNIFEMLRPMDDRDLENQIAALSRRD